MSPALLTTQPPSSSSHASEKQRHSDLLPPPTSNAELVRLLGLQSHPEGGTSPQPATATASVYIDIADLSRTRRCRLLRRDGPRSAGDPLAIRRCVISTTTDHRMLDVDRFLACSPVHPTVPCQSSPHHLNSPDVNIRHRCPRPAPTPASRRPAAPALDDDLLPPHVRGALWRVPPEQIRRASPLVSLSFAGADA